MGRPPKYATEEERLAAYKASLKAAKARYEQKFPEKHREWKARYSSQPHVKARARERYNLKRLRLVEQGLLTIQYGRGRPRLDPIPPEVLSRILEARERQAAEGGEEDDKKKMSFTVAIPSYKRPDIFEAETLTRILLPHGLLDKTVLFLSTQEDYDEYGQRFPEIRRTLAPRGLMATTNHIMRYFGPGEPFVLMHDDVSDFYELDHAGRRLARVQDLRDVFGRVFAELRASGLSLAGFYPVRAPLWMRKLPAVTRDLRYIYDPVCCLLNPQLCLSLGGKGDYELSMRAYLRDGGVLRYNRMCFKTGYFDQRHGGESLSLHAENSFAAKAMEAFPELVAGVRRHVTRGTTTLFLRDMRGSLDRCRCQRRRERRLQELRTVAAFSPDGEDEEAS